MSNVQFNETDGMPIEREPLRWLRTLTTGLFLFGIFTIIWSIFMIPSLGISPNTDSLISTLGLFLGASIIVSSLAISMLHHELRQRIQRTEDLEKRINELNCMLAQKP